MRTKILIGIILFTGQIGLAQDKKVLLSLGGGTTQALNSGKTGLVGNGFNIQGDAFLPFLTKGGNNKAQDNGFALGINIGGNYTGLRNSSTDNNTVADKYQVYSATHTVSATETGTVSNLFSGQAGVQAIFGWNKFRIAPIVAAGYNFLSLQGYTQTGNYTANGETQQMELVKREKQNFRFLVFKPQLRIGYSLNSTVSLFASSTLTIGPDINAVTDSWLPQGGFNDKNTYEPQQMKSGSWSATTHAGQYRSMEINLGLTMAIGKKKISKGPGASSASYAKTIATDPGAGTVQNNSPVTDFNTTRSNRDNRLSTNSNNDSLPGTNPSQDVLNNRMVSKDSGSSMPTRLSMTPTTARQTQGKTFGEKMAQGTAHAGANLRAVNDTINPLYEDKGLEGTNPMAERKNGIGRGKATLKDMTVTKRNEMAIVEPSTGKSISEKGLKRNEAAARQTPGTSFGERVALVAGQPIGGIVVKGGKNPGGNTVNTITNDNGEMIFTAEEAGVYTFHIKAPENEGANERRVEVLKSNKTGDPNPSKNKREKRSYTAGRKNEVPAVMMMTPGTPIGGIVVKGGKNPGGNAINVVTDEKGTITFTVQEAGEYKLQMTAPETSQKSISEKGVSASKPSK